MNESTANLKRRHNTWYAVVNVPRPMRARLGKSELVRSLKTQNLREANRLKLPVLAEMHAAITAAEKGEASAITTITLDFRNALQKAAPTDADLIMDDVRQETRDILETKGPKEASRFFQAATGKTVILADLVDTFVEEQTHVRAKTRAHHKTALNAFISWAGLGVTAAEADRSKAGEYVGVLKRKHADKTVQRMVSSLSSFWSWLMMRGHIENNPLMNPWRGQGVHKKSKRGVQGARRAWKDEELVVGLTLDLTGNGINYQAAVPDLVRLALLTGARIEELCAMKVADVKRRDGRLWLSITEGKTAAALREIPVHPLAEPIIERRLSASGDGFLFPYLPTGGPDKTRSHHVSKVFGRAIRKAGLADKGVVFHSLRNTFMDHMEAAEVPESTVKLLVGHERKSLTFGGYSKGVRVDLSAAIDKLQYSTEVKALLTGQ